MSPYSTPVMVDLDRLLRQREGLRQVIEEISSELELRPLLTHIVRHACELLEAHDGSIGLYDEQRDVIRTEAVYRMPEGELGSEMPPGVGLAGQILLHRRPLIFDRYGDVPGHTLKSLADNAVVAVPIFWRGELIGFFGLGARPPHRFTSQDAETLSLFGRHAAIAIENARLFERAQRAAALEERQRLARDLHDSVTQMLTSLNMIAQSLATAWRRDPAEGERRTERLAQLARSALAEMRALLKELRLPASVNKVETSDVLIAGIVQLRSFGLGAALQWLARDVPSDAPDVRLDLGGYEAQAAEIEEVLFRVAQEALANALRHAGARQVRIAAAVDGAVTRLQVRDDGAGFDPGRLRAPDQGDGRGLGLQTMRERVEALGGNLSIDTEPGRGTLVEAALPARAREQP
ncbi:MAG TPA: GAF domain-containing sensor histidine kinase [Thermoanaerobaculia bacterium]|jgi:signal transduction histidine kinase|nr:GAF domain-containing sensor histidine kinase [Thermoanaerobaculia bacterium]